MTVPGKREDPTGRMAYYRRARGGVTGCGTCENGYRNYRRKHPKEDYPGCSHIRCRQDTESAAAAPIRQVAAWREAT